MTSERPRLVLHIGQHKTGSKALQAFLAHNQRRLLDHGLLYPVEEHPSHGIRAYAISQFRLFALLRRELLAEGPEPDAARAFWDTVQAFCRPFESARSLFDALDYDRRQAGAHTVILSAEDLFDMQTAHATRFDPGLVAAGSRRLAKLAAAFGYDPRVVVYLRRQDHLLAAHYVQYIKGSPVHDVDFRSFAQAFADRLDTRSILDGWARAFGRERLHVRRHEPSALPDGIVPDFFASALEIPVPATCEPPTADAESVNRSLDRDFVEFIRLLNRRYADGQPVYPREVVLGVALESPALEPARKGIAAWLSPAERRGLLEAHASGNAAIVRELLGREDEPLFAEPPPGDDATWAPYPGLSAERLLAIAMAVHQAILPARAPATPTPVLPPPSGPGPVRRFHGI